MTYNEFKFSVLGQYVDVDGYPKSQPYQCFDLAQLYVTTCLDVPKWVLAGCGSAKNLMYPPKLYDVLQYFDEVDIHAMKAGDLCIWDWHDDNRPDGHVAIFDSFDGTMCHYLSQNPGPVHTEVIDGGEMKAFRRKGQEPIVQPVARDTTKNQIEVLIDDLNVRDYPRTTNKSLGYAQKGFYNWLEKYNNDGYDWYKLAYDQWIASKEGEWTKLYPAQQPTEPPTQAPTTPPTQPPEEYIKLKILDRKDGNVLVNVPMWIKE